MFNTITKFYNMLSEIISIHTIKKNKRNKIYDGYMADDEFDNIIDGDGDGDGDESGDGDEIRDDDNTVMIDGLEQILLKVLKL